MPLFQSRSAFYRRLFYLLVIILVVLLVLRSPQTKTTSGSSHHTNVNNQYGASLVVASQKEDDTTWLQNKFNAWQKYIYVVDDPQAALTVPTNKGREAMVYLTYIIEHYDDLNDVTVFIHSQRYQWHNDDPDYDNQHVLSRLQMPYVVSEGFANLRCAWRLGCKSEIRPHYDADHPKDTPTAGHIYKDGFQQLFPGVKVPGVVGAACCAQFAVSRDTIRHRPKADYLRFRKWIIETDVTDELSGRVMEYSWHMIFGKQPVHCPYAEDCYCKLYGMCGLECGAGSCTGQYELPDYSELPVGWPYIGWDEKPRRPVEA